MTEIPFSQTKEYFSLLKEEGKTPFYIKEDNENYLLLYKTYKYILGCRIPFLFKISSHEGIVSNSPNKLEALLERIKSLLKNPLILRAQITTHPFFNPKESVFFNGKSYTYLLKLNRFKNVEEYLQFLPAKTRAEIRRGLRQELVIKEVLDKKDLQVYYQFVNESRKSNNIKEIPIEHFELSWKIFSKSKMLRYFLIYKEETPLASQGVNVSLNGFTLVQTTTSKKAYELKLKANDVMQFYMIKTAIEENKDYVDWGGAQPKTNNPKMKSIDKFKAKWGGELVSYPVFTKGY